MVGIDHDTCYCAVKVNEDKRNHLNHHKAFIKVNRFQSMNKKKQPIIFIDGSYKQSQKISSYGFAVDMNGVIIQRDFGIVTDNDMLHLQSLGAELYAFIRAMEWSIANNYKQICIVYDCDGIVDLIKNKHKPQRQKGKMKFLKLLLKYSLYVEVEFIHKSRSKQLKRKHLESHHLSRITADLLM